MKRTLFFIFCFSFFISTYAENHLSPPDVSDVMEQLFEYHIDKKEMTPILMQRTLKIYVTSFDPTHAYLLEEEVQPYLEPSARTLNVMLQEYAYGRINTFFELNETLSQSIERARGWRQEWMEDPVALLAVAQEVDLDGKPEKTFARDLADLKSRHYDRLLRLLAFQMEELGYSSYQGKEAKLVALADKQIGMMENAYLGLDDHGKVISAEKKQHNIVLRTLKAMAHSLDAHTAYYSPEEAYVMKVQLEKGMSGIGVVLREGIDGITIHEIVKGGPAAHSGELQAGDTIVEVDREDIDGHSFQHVLEVMRGKEGSKMELGLIRHHPAGEEFFRVELTRSRIVIDDKRVDVEAVPYLDGVIGKITLYSFYEGENDLSSEKDLQEAILSLKEQGPLYGLVLDMRENSGGFLSQAVKVSGLFISSGVVVISKYSDGTIKYYRAVDGERFYDGPLVVLVSRGSASATEIVAQTLQDYGVAVVVGDEQTYGKGTIQHQTVTSNHSKSFFKVTIGRYYTVSGRSTQIDGVKSDILVPSHTQFEELGEVYLDYPLPSDRVASAYEDTLEDVDPFARRWFQKYYTPTLQEKETTWEELLPTLKARSEKRLKESEGFQTFLTQVKNKVKSIEVIKFDSKDLQMEESVSIVKDMIELKQEAPVQSNS